jgi:hypothetical protein
MQEGSDIGRESAFPRKAPFSVTDWKTETFLASSQTNPSILKADGFVAEKSRFTPEKTGLREHLKPVAHSKKAQLARFNFFEESKLPKFESEELTAPEMIRE